jgi:hypothetical protein
VLGRFFMCRRTYSPFLFGWMDPEVVEHGKNEGRLRLTLFFAPYQTFIFLDILFEIRNQNKILRKKIDFFFSINQIDECHVSQDQSQKLNYLRDPLPEDRFIHLFNKNI